MLITQILAVEGRKDLFHLNIQTSQISPGFVNETREVGGITLF